MESSEQFIEPLKIVIIGLSYSGKKLVAQMIAKQFNCQLLKLPENQIQTAKTVSNLCFQNYRGRGIYVLERANQTILKTLRKRNFVNVISVQASAYKRYQNYLSQIMQKINEQQKQTESSQSSIQQSNKQSTQPEQKTVKPKQTQILSIETFCKIDDRQNDQQYERCLNWVKVRIGNRQGFDFLKEQIMLKKQLIIKPFRPSWQEYFMKIADIAKRRSNCMKSSVGAVIVNQQNRVISTGYNGTARGLTSCYKEGCKRCNSNESKGLDMCTCLHAQQSAIIQVGINRTKGCHLYTTLYPCFSCAKVIKQAGITKIFYLEQYAKQDSGKVFLQTYFNPQTDIKQIYIDNLYY